MNTTATSTTLLVSALFLSGSLFAQSVPFEFTWPIPPSIDTSGGITGMATGDFNGDLIADAFIVTDHKAYFVPSPDIFSSLFAIEGVDAVDVATLPGGGPNGVDAVLVVGSQGLYVVQRGTSSPAMSATLLAAGWSTVVQVLVADVDGDEAIDILGLDADGVTLRRLEAASGSYDSSSSTFTQLGTNHVAEIDVLDWNGDDDLEIAAVLDDSFAVYDLAMVRQAVYAGSGIVSGVTAQPIRHASGGKDRLAIVYETPTGTQWLKEVSPSHQSTGVGLGSLGVMRNGTAAANLFPSIVAPRGDDLVLSQTFSPWQPLLANISTTTSTSEPYSTSAGGPLMVQPWGYPSSHNKATPAIADFDNDSDPDILFPWADAPASIYVVRSYDSPAEAKKIYTSDADSLLWENEENEFSLTLELKEPAIEEEFDWVQLIVWHRGVDSAGELVAGVDPSPSTYYVDLSAGWPTSGALTAEIGLFETEFPNKAQYFILMRGATFDGEGNYVKVGTHSMSIWVADDGKFEELLDNYAMSNASIDGAGGGEPGGSPGMKSNGTPVGGTSPTMVPIDPFDPTGGTPDPPTTRP